MDNVLQSLMALFVEHLSTLSADITACIKSKVIEWMNFQSLAFTQQKKHRPQRIQRSPKTVLSVRDQGFEPWTP